MANVLINEDTMTNIADAIRSKKGVSTTYKPNEMPSAIDSISGGGITPTGTINITTNGTHDVTNYASASVAVPQGTTPTGTKEISITQNGTTTEDVTNYASAQITVNVSGGGATIGKASQYVEFTPSSDATSSSRYTVQLVPPTSAAWWIYVWSKEKPSPPADGYIALVASFSAGMCSGNSNGILRANGTIGSDTALGSFNSTTGVLALGGNYGTFVAGLTYCVLLVEA